MVSNDVTELIGIYDAESTIIGDVSYWLMPTHCAISAWLNSSKK
jgi:hypothetical protein